MVPVSQATLSLWLRNIALTSEQRRRLAELKLRGARAGVAILRESKQRRIAAVRRVALQEARERLGSGDVNWAVGAVLYWGEGAKTKPWAPSRLVAFTNMEIESLLVFRQWLLRYAGVTLMDIGYDLYIHPDADINRARSHWARVLQIEDCAIKTYLKRPNPSTRRGRIGNVYYGTMRLRVRRSTMLLHRIEGWIQGIIKYCGVG